MKKVNTKLLGILITLSITIIGYGVTNRPIVGYNMETPDIIYTFYNHDSNFLTQEISLGLSNSGNTNAALLLNLKCKNATISNETFIKSYMSLINNNEVQIRSASPKNTPLSFYKVILEINKSSESFSCKYIAGKNTKDTSLSGIINTFFGEIHGYYPIDFNYKKIDNNFVFSRNNEI